MKGFMPDFFILGAPKCGTSALYEYLRDHSQVFMPYNKEPHYFSSDMYVRNTGLSRRVDNPDDYAALFSEAKPYQITGEGSTWYLFSQVAVSEIIKKNPSAKFIVMLRNPVDMVKSLHNHHVRKLYDDVDDFDQAWALQRERVQGRKLPKYCPDPKMLRYREACCFPSMLERLFDLVPREQVYVIIFEEFTRDLRKSYLEVLAFLGVPDDQRKSFEKVNPNRRLRSKRLYEILTYKPFPINVIYPALKQVVNAIGLRPGRAVFEHNVAIEARTETNPATMRCLAEAFAPDIPETEAVLGRSLEVWRRRIETLQQEG